MRIVFACLLTGLATLLLAPPAAAQSLRCDGKLVGVGDRRYDAIVACGEPDLRVPVRLDVIGAVAVLPYEEIWYYNFGPRRLLRTLRLRGDRIIAIESAGYGFSPDTPGSCRPEDLRREMSTLELLARCGEPVDREQRTRSFAQRVGTPFAYNSIVLEEQWIYDFGPQRFYRIITLIDGRVTSIDTGNRGSRRPQLRR